MEERAWFSYAFFVIGIEFIYWNMRWSGINHPQNPAWTIVSWIHVIAIGSVIAIILLWSLLYVDFLRSIKKKKVDKPKEIIKENNSDLKKITEQIEVEKQKRIEEQQKLEEQRKQEAIKRRRERSAKAAAHDALDDFL